MFDLEKCAILIDDVRPYERPLAQKYRLVKLALFLLTVHPDYFSMKVFRALTDCGTVACAAGWTNEALGGNRYRVGFGQFRGIDYTSYIFMVYGMHHSDTLFNTCFASHWGCVDNSEIGAAARILFAVDSGATIAEKEMRHSSKMYQNAAYEQFSRLVEKYTKWLENPTL